jgi:hypothetical protein
MDLKRLTGRLKLCFLTEIGRFHWHQGEEVAHFTWFGELCKRSFLTSRQHSIFFSPKQELWLKSPHVNEVSCEFIHYARPTNHFPVRKMITIVERKTFWIYLAWLATVLPSLGKGLRVTTLSSWRMLGPMLYPTYPLQLIKKKHVLHLFNMKWQLVFHINICK